MNEDRNVNELAEGLKGLRPASSEMDFRVLFYEAGFNAGKSQQTAPGGIKIAPLIAAGLLAAIVTAPASYRAGRRASVQTESASDVAQLQTQTMPNAVATENPIDVDGAPIIETANQSQRAKLLASWIDPLRDLAETAKIERQTGTTLAAFHSSLVERENSAANWADFPFPLTSSVNRNSSSSFYDHINSTSPQPLAVSDLRKLALSPEATR